MPYIDSDRREAIVQDGAEALSVGELTFVLYDAVISYLRAHDDSYATRAEILAALEGAKLEFYRRQVVPYEDRKIQENGDVD